MVILRVRAPEGADNSPRRMARADATIHSKGGMFVAPQGQPAARPDGTYEVRVFEDAWVHYVRRTLEDHHGLQVVGLVQIVGEQVVDGSPLEDLLDE
jgi:hypothetical protein